MTSSRRARRRDALATVLPAGVTAPDTMVGFAPARCYTGSPAGAAAVLTDAALLVPAPVIADHDGLLLSASTRPAMRGTQRIRA